MTEPSEQRPTLAPGTRLGEFVIERRLGAGGLGEVYAARHHEIAEKRAAVKILLPQHATNAEVRMRFVREARASAALRHPNAVNVFGAGIEGTTPYIVMEFLEGEDLDARIERAPMSVTDAVDVLIPVASALARAHDAPRNGAPNMAADRSLRADRDPATPRRSRAAPPRPSWARSRCSGRR